MAQFRKKIEFSDINIDELLDIQHNQLSLRVEKCNLKDQVAQLIQ